MNIFFQSYATLKPLTSLWPCSCMYIPALLWRICKVRTTLAWWFIRWVNWDSLCLGAARFPENNHSWRTMTFCFFTKADSFSYLPKFIIVTSYERHSVSNHGLQQRKRQSSVSLALCEAWPRDTSTKRPEMRKPFPYVMMLSCIHLLCEFLRVQSIFVSLTLYVQNIWMHLQLISFLHTDTTQVDEILSHVRQELTCSTWSIISWVLMPWRCKEPGHQQPCWWLCWTGTIRSTCING